MLVEDKGIKVRQNWKMMQNTYKSLNRMRKSQATFASIVGRNFSTSATFQLVSLRSTTFHGQSLNFHRPNLTSTELRMRENF